MLYRAAIIIVTATMLGQCGPRKPDKPIGSSPAVDKNSGSDAEADDKKIVASCNLSIVPPKAYAGDDVEIVLTTTGNIKSAEIEGDKVDDKGGKIVRKLSDGHLTFKASIEDESGKSKNCAAEIKLLVPMTLVKPTLRANSPTNDGTPRWEWDAVKGSDGYRYQIDDSDLATSGIAVTKLFFAPTADLSEGVHTLFLQAKAQDGKSWSPIASLPVTIDITKPQKPILTGVETTNVIPEWEWSTGGGGGSGIFRFRMDNPDLDNAQETTLTIYKPATLNNGIHTLYVQERDAAGNWSDPAFLKTTFDSTAPNAPNVLGVPFTNNKRPTWTWTSTETSFRYKLDSADLTSGATATNLLSYAQLTDLPAGLHSLYVQARDSAGNWSAAGHFDTMVDLTPPGNPVVVGPGPTSQTQPTWTWTSGGGGQGLYRIRLDNATFDGTELPINTLSFMPAVPLTGSHTLYVQENDNAGNWSLSGSGTAIIDNEAPSMPIITTSISLTNNSRPTWNWISGGGGIGVFRYRIDSGVWSANTSVLTFMPATALADGPRLFEVQEKDGVDNWSQSASKSITVDTVAPLPPVVSSSTATTTNRRPTWTFSGGGGGNANFRFRLDNPDLSGISPLSVASYAPLADLSIASHTLYVQESDAAGNWSQSNSYAINIISATAPNAPVVSITGGTPTKSPRPIWTWVSGGGGGNGSYRFRIDNPNLTMTSAESVTTYTPTADLLDGAHTLFVQEQNSSGVWSTSGSSDIVVDLTAPNPPLVTSTTPTTNTTPTWSWTSGGGGSGNYKYKLNDPTISNGESYAAATSFTPSTPLPVGTYILYVSERDAVGNWSLAGSSQIVIQSLQAPNQPIVTGPGITNNKRPSWIWSSGGNGVGIYRFRLDNPDLSGAAELAVINYKPIADLTDGFHTLYVQEKGSSGNWSPSGFVSGNIDTVAPTAPTISVTGATTVRPTFSWTSTDAGTPKTFFYRFHVLGLVGPTTTIGTTATSFTPIADLLDDTYVFELSERDVAGNDSAVVSKEVTVGTFALPTITGISNTVYACDQIGFSWNTVPGASRYEVEVSTDLVPWSVPSVEFSTGRNYQGLIPATKYYFRVRAFNAGGGHSPYATTSNTTQPAPTKVLNMSVGLVSRSQVHLDWDIQPAAVEYIIERGVNGIAWGVIGSVAAPKNYFDDTLVDQGAFYYYRVTAKNGAVQGPASDIKTVAIPGCAGSIYATGCWYLASKGKDCSNWCGTHGGYNALTETVAAASRPACSLAVTAIGYTAIDQTATGFTYNGLGCFLSAPTGGAKRFDAAGSSPTAADSNYYRICACNN